MATAPDPRVQQANERTFLAWVRTGIAIGAIGLGVAGILPPTDPTWVRPALSWAVTLMAIATLWWGVRRFKSAQRAIEAGEQIPALQNAHWFAGALASGLVVTVVVLLFSA